MNQYKNYFPIMRHNKNLAYLDNAATTQKPDMVIDAIADYYKQKNANPLRGLYELSQKATDAYENARKKIAAFINAPKEQEIIYTRNASESLNIIAYCLSDLLLKPDDEILISIMEHHSNMIPWQQAAKRHNAKLIYLYPDKNGCITTDELKSKLSAKTKILSLTHVSNVLGTMQNIKELIAIAHSNNTVVSVDGAQAIPHAKIDVDKLDCDFYSFSGHKMYAPMGIGILYGKQTYLEKMPPFLTGGEMIDYVDEQTATFAELPYKFEAGTQNVGGAVGLAAAIDFMQSISYDTIIKRETALSESAGNQLSRLPYVTIYGDKDYTKHHGVIAFNIEGVHPHDVASLMDAGDVAIRGGHHCAQPLMRYLKCNFCCRASMAFYNDEEDINKLVERVKYIRSYFHGAQ
ncbi:SufS family cysteine desulfurase [Pectinatus sottacetonis]|uniref:SufS family cysteine desulfurase n=1 Tax=Pectinatus sottacetonis TaxID=1002795 RepID=UPI001E368049|nr:SufS family cysteine desulfurase [Pectinatus sottacetonis]